MLPMLSPIVMLIRRASNPLPDLFAPLKTSLQLERGQGTATFTRASTAYVEDHEGVLRLCKSGEARFTGARRVENLITYSEDITKAVWGITSGTKDSYRKVTFTNDSGLLQYVSAAFSRGLKGRVFVARVKLSADFNGQVTLRLRNDDGTTFEANFATLDITTAPTWYSLAIQFVNTDASRVSLQIMKSIGGLSSIYIDGAQLEEVTGQSNQNPSEYVSNGVPVVPGPELISDGSFDTGISGWVADTIYPPASFSWVDGALQVVANPGNAGVKIPISTKIGGVYRISANIVGAGYISTSNGVGGWGPTAHVPVFTATAATTYITAATYNSNTATFDNLSVKEDHFHGCNIDGVKYFDYENGNTVVDNIVIEARGAAIPEATLKGYLAEGQRTNLFSYSNDLSNAYWTKANCDYAIDPTIQAPDGSYSATKLTQITSPNGPLGIAKSITVVSGLTYTYTRYLKAGTYPYAVMYLFTGTQANGHRQWFDLQNGVVGNSATFGTGLSVSNIDISPAKFGWYKCTMTVVTDATTLNTYLYFADNDSTGSIARTDGHYGYAWEAQLEQAFFSSSPIPTTTSSLTRAADVLTYPSANNIDGTKGAAYAELSLNRPSYGAYSAAIGFNTSVMLLGHSSSMATNSIRAYEGTGKDAYVTGGIDMHQGIAKAASKWGGVNQKAFKDGLSGSPGNFSGNFNITSPIFIGTTNAVDKPWFGNIKNVKIWKKSANDATLMRMTA